MHKTIYTFFTLFIIFTLIPLAIPAAAQDDGTTGLPTDEDTTETPPTWNLSQVTNRTSADVYIAFSTWRPARQARQATNTSRALLALPAGHRITAYYRLKPGQTHKFYALGKNAFYLLTYQAGKFIKPLTYYPVFKAPASNNAFVIVRQKEISDVTVTNTVLYPTPFSAVKYPNQNGYVKFENGTSVSITNDWVDILSSTDDSLDNLPQKKGVEDPGQWASDYPKAAKVFSTFHESFESVAIRSAFSDILDEFKDADFANIDDLKKAFAADYTFRSVSAQYEEIKNAGLLTLFTNSDNNKYEKTTKHVHTLVFTSTEIDALTTVLRADAQFKSLQEYYREPISISLSPSRTTETEPGTTISLTFTVTQRDGKRYGGRKNIEGLGLKTSNGTVEFDGGNIPNKDGQVKAKLKTKRLAPKASSPSQSYIVTATIGKDDVKSTGTYTTKWTPYYLSVNWSGWRDPTDSRSSSRRPVSGQRTTVTAKLTSKYSKTALEGYTILFKESESEIVFNPTSVKTNSNGKALSTLRTGSYGSASFNVSVSGHSYIAAKKFDLYVLDRYKTSTKQKRFRSEYAGPLDCTWGGWEDKDYYHTFTFPGTVVDFTQSNDVDWVDRHNVNGNDGYTFKSGKNVKVKVTLEEHCIETNSLTKIITAIYIDNAGAPGSPSLQPQLRPQTDQLSAVWQDLSQVPSETALLANYPNPFNPETWIPYQLSESAEVTLSIYSMDGKLVQRLDLGHQAAGTYQSKSRAAYWDGKNSVGEQVASGIYFYTLTAGDFSATRKMLIMK